MKKYVCDRCSEEITTSVSGRPFEPQAIGYIDDGMGGPEWHLCKRCTKSLYQFMRGFMLSEEKIDDR